MTHPFRDFAFVPNAAQTASWITTINLRVQRLRFYLLFQLVDRRGGGHKQRGRYWWARRATDPARGRSTCRGIRGHARDAEAMQREVMEETGLSVISPNTCSPFRIFTYIRGLKCIRLISSFDARLTISAGLKHKTMSLNCSLSRENLTFAIRARLYQASHTKIVSDNENNITI